MRSEILRTGFARYYRGGHGKRNATIKDFGFDTICEFWKKFTQYHQPDRRLILIAPQAAEVVSHFATFRELAA